MSARFFCALLGLSLACGCMTSPVHNRRLASYAPDEGYRFSNLAPGEGNSDSLFVILTFSGGGTRAAALAMGVMEELRDTTIAWEGQERSLLDEVDVISSVSGGSLAAAFYGIYRERMFDDFAEEILYRDIQGSLIKAVFSLSNTFRLWSPYFGRTDVLAESFDHGVFEKQTFADLHRNGTRPYIIINATDAALGTQFSFTQDQFDLLYSDLDPFRIGHAVAASAAFPGLLTPLTLRNYPKPPDLDAYAWVDPMLQQDPTTPGYYRAKHVKNYLDPEWRYVQIVDGGVADNLGLMPVLDSLDRDDAAWSLPRMIGEGKIRQLVVISVNAARPLKRQSFNIPKPLNLIATLVAAGNIPLGNFTRAQLEYMKLKLDTMEREESLHRELKTVLSPAVFEAVFPDSAPGPVDFHFVEVDFDRIADPVERSFFEAIPTTFKLPRETVDRLRTKGAEILRGHPEFQELEGQL